MRRSAKQKLLTSADAQLLQPSYAEAMALSSSAAGDAELNAEFTSVSEQMKHTPRKPFRP